MRTAFRLKHNRLAHACALAAFVVLAACSAPHLSARRAAGPDATPAAQSPGARVTPKPTYASPVLEQLVAAAVARTNERVQYDGSYYKIDYPNGDVPAERGACTDEVIRAYRAVGIDLQKEVHEDMQANFAAYPRRFGLTRTDTNIDHRRVPNLMTFFARKGKLLPVTELAADYAPGDIVTWDLGAGLTHIGIVIDVPSEEEAGRYQIMHNIGAGPQLQDALFAWPDHRPLSLHGAAPAATAAQPARASRCAFDSTQQRRRRAEQT